MYPTTLIAVKHQHQWNSVSNENRLRRFGPLPRLQTNPNLRCICTSQIVYVLRSDCELVSLSCCSELLAAGGSFFFDFSRQSKFEAYSYQSSVVETMAERFQQLDESEGTQSASIEPLPAVCPVDDHSLWSILSMSWYSIIFFCIACITIRASRAQDYAADRT